ncbi:MAG: hypothetical protein ACLQK8_01790 [Streptosporangiaceae bacterium]
MPRRDLAAPTASLPVLGSGTEPLPPAMVFRSTSRRAAQHRPRQCLLYGAAFGMIVNDAVPAHVVQGIIAMIIHGLGHLLGLGGVPPALPPQA